jgi:hypothetical protein
VTIFGLLGDSRPLQRRLDTRPWLSRRDSAGDILHILSLFATFAVLDRATRALARIDETFLESPILVGGAIRSHPWMWAAGAVALAAIGTRWPQRLFGNWSTLENGRVLRSLALALLAFLTWVGVLYEFNYLLGELHLIDRLLLLGLAVASFYRPIFLTLFVVQSRVITAQFVEPFGSTSARNMDDLLVFALLAIAAAHLLFVLIGRRETAPVLLVIGAAMATHYFVPGRTKLATDWMTITELSNLPLSSYTAGFMGHGDGAWARSASNVIRSIGWAALAGTLLIELGSVVAVAHPKLMRVWLIGPILFHMALFALTGFWFLGWLILEIGVLIILLKPELREWVAQNATPARAGIALFVVVAGGSFLFHPYHLTWYDSPISYGYRMEARGESGVVYQVPISAFAPFVQDLSFMRAKLAPTEPASGGYGYVVSQDEYRALQAVDSFEDVRALEGVVEASRLASGRDFMLRFMEHANNGPHGAWESLSPPDYFWTSSPNPQFDFQEPIESLDVLLVTSIHNNGDPLYETSPILSVELDDRGHPEVTNP